MERKLEISFYHLEAIRALLPDAVPDESGLPPIALQAHFEACVWSVIALVDQLAAGVAAVVPELVEVHDATPRRVCLALDSVNDPVAIEIKEFIERIDNDGRLSDLRSVRNRSTHRFDQKQYVGGQWTVGRPDWLPPGVDQFNGSRHLDEYLETMTELGRDVHRSASEVERLAEDLASRVRR